MEPQIKKFVLMNNSILNFLLDLRDFAYVHYSKRYGKVSAKSWSGYRLLFTSLFLSYYLIIFIFIIEVILKGIDFSFLRTQYLLYLVCCGVVLLSPLIITCHWVIKKLEIIQPLYYKLASADYSRKEWRGWTTLVFGWILLFSFFWIFNHVS